jgi:hypothetical protein
MLHMAYSSVSCTIAAVYAIKITHEENNFILKCLPQSSVWIPNQRYFYVRPSQGSRHLNPIPEGILRQGCDVLEYHQQLRASGTPHEAAFSGLPQQATKNTPPSAIKHGKSWKVQFYQCTQ